MIIVSLYYIKSKGLLLKLLLVIMELEMFWKLYNDLEHKYVQL